MPEVFDILVEDHRRVEQLFQQYEQSSDADVALQICNELTIHAMLEEELVYPILSTKVGRGMAEEPRREHYEAKQLIVQIENGVRNGTDVSSLVKELHEDIQHHVEEEERDIFPKLYETVPKTIDVLGADLIERRKRLVNQLAEAREVGQPSSSVIYANKPATNDLR